mgnify:FL=1
MVFLISTPFSILRMRSLKLTSSQLFKPKFLILHLQYQFLKKTSQTRNHQILTKALPLKQNLKQKVLKKRRSQTIKKTYVVIYPKQQSNKHLVMHLSPQCQNFAKNS